MSHLVYFLPVSILCCSYDVISCFSHRPVDVHNVYNQIQVQLLMNQDELENMPDYEQLFKEDVGTMIDRTISPYL